MAWVERMDGGARPGPAAAPHPARARSTLDSLQISASQCIFPDGARVMLSKAGEDIVHVGTTAVRGPLGVSREDWAGLGLTVEQAQAADYVAHWYGAPVDAVFASRQGLAWGFWPFRNEDIVWPLLGFQRRAPEDFERLLGRFDINLVKADDFSAPELRVGTGGTVHEGRRALRALVHPRRVAVLARAARHRAAIMAQAEAVVQNVLQPALAARLKDGRTVKEGAQDPVLLAALFHAAASLDPTDFAGLVRGIEVPTHELLDTRSQLVAIANALKLAGERDAAANVLRSQSSPELHAVPGRTTPLEGVAAAPPSPTTP